MAVLTERPSPPERNTVEGSCRRDLSLSGWFDEQAARTPDAIAIASHDGDWTYRQVRQRVEAVASAVRMRGVLPGEAVGLWARRSPDAVVGLLGILRAGGAYVPIPVDAPAARARTILADAGIRHVVSCEPLDARGGFESVGTILVRECVQERGVPVIGYPTAAGLACVILTSGSTGVPKGVALTHRSFVNLMEYRLETQFRAGDFAVSALTAPLHFDPSLIQILSPLLTGGTLVVLPELADLMASPWYEWLTVLTGLPSLILEVTRRRGFPKSARVVSLGAEAIPPALLDAVVKSGTVDRLMTVYGVTECACYSTAAVLYDRTTDGPAPPPHERLRNIGRPIANTRVHVLDEHGRSSPIGVPGEIHIGGEGLARGYLKRPDLTNERFVPDPFVPGERLYRTGDVGRQNVDGTFEFLGRLDEQVKFRGHRIELPEVEAILATHPNVAQCAVTLRGGPDTEQRLVAYVVPRSADGTDPSSLRAHLSARLPGHSIPSAFVKLERLPTGPTGKVDRQALPAPAAEHLASADETVASSSGVEAGLAELWRECLGIERIGSQDDFFALGGYSLLALRLFEAIESRFGRRLSMDVLLENPTVASLARRIEAPDVEREPFAVIPIRAEGTSDPLFVVHSLTGSLLFWRKFLPGLHDGQPVFGLSAPKDPSSTPHIVGLEALAAQHVERLTAFRPTGGIRLAGYSAGGVIAYEIARQLEARNRRVTFLGLIDARIAPRKRPGLRGAPWISAFFRNLPCWMADHLLHSTGRSRWERLRTTLHKMQRRLTGANRRSTVPLVTDNGRPGHVPDAGGAYERLLGPYRPGAYSGPLTLLRIRSLPLFECDSLDYGWCEFAPRVDVRIAARCHHNAMVVAPHVDEVARTLQAALDESA